MKYEGYEARIEFDEENEIFHGRVLGIMDVITFQGTTIDELRKAFSDSVDDYLAFCKERGEDPNKPYSGRFVLRMTPEVHRKADIRAQEVGLSLNRWVSLVLERATNEPDFVRTE